MDPIRLQQQIRDNTSDLMSFCADLKQWGEEMKHKDTSLKDTNNSANVDTPAIRNKVKKRPKSKEGSSLSKNPPKSSKSISGVDYSAWDKYDVEAECSKIDEQKSEDDDSGELTDECDEALREEAVYHKEKGNKFVKKERWNQAIECYTKAIECYAYDPIFYANRALCHLKNSDYRLAESDCTSAIQLDKTYVKAYHRRAQAREALNQLNEAHADLLNVFDYEPDNKESKVSLARIEKKLESVVKEASAKTNDVGQRPKSKFTLSRQQHKAVPHIKPQNVSTANSESSLSSTTAAENVKYWPSGNNIELVTTINKAPHLRSKIPLRRINIIETDSITAPQEEVTAQPLPSLTSNNTIIKCDDFKIVERKIENYKKVEDIKTDNKYKKELVSEKQYKANSFSFAVPETSVQFGCDWRLLKNNPEWQYLYLKQIHPKQFKSIFNESLECEIFSGIISTLAENFIQENIPVYEYLLGLSEVKRFNMLAMFMTDSDKEGFWKLVDYMKSDKSISGLEIENIVNKYGL